MLKQLSVLFLLSALLSVPVSLFAQDDNEYLSPFAHGAGRTYAITARGLDAVGLNPSLLALGTPKPFELSIMPILLVGVHAGPSLPDFNSIVKGFSNSALSNQAKTTDGTSTLGDSTRESLTNLLADNKLSSNVDVRIFGISYDNPVAGSFALTWTFHAGLRVNIADSILDFLGKLAYAEIGQHTLTPHTVDMQGLSYSEYTLSYAYNILGTGRSGDFQLLGGLGLKYVAGIAMMRMNPGTFSVNYPSQPGANSLVNANYAIQFAYSDIPAFSLSFLTSSTAGSGFGADVGFTIGTFDNNGYSPWHAALSVSDIGTIRWTKHTDIRSANVSENINLQNTSTDTINSSLKALAGTLDTTDAPFTTSLPTTLHIAGSLDLAQIGVSLAGVHLSAAAEYALGLTDIVGAPNHGRFGLAFLLEHPSSGFSYHTALGMTTQEGITDLTMAFGIGIANSFMIDLGTAGLTNLFKTGGYADAVIGMKILF